MNDLSLVNKTPIEQAIVFYLYYGWKNEIDY